MAPTTKRVRIEPNDTLKELKEMFDRRMYALEKKVEFLINTCTTILGSCELHKKGHTNSCCAQLLLPKIKVIDNYIRSVKNQDDKEEKIQSSAPIVLLSNVNTCNVEPQVIELNSEKDLPSGSWLGDEDNPKARVRVNISPENLVEINEGCHTPEKMALTLLDFLFPKEVLAVSNLSGKGKHSKKQLDPLLIYAIRCHLMYKFNITEQDWHRIKQNLDSKCRTIWKKNHMGLLINSNNNNNKTLNDDSINNLSEDVELPNNLNNTGLYRRSSESRSNSPLKNITTLPSIMEEDPADVVNEGFNELLYPELRLIESECFDLDSKCDADLITAKLFNEALLDCQQLDS
ncbi:uncharacterized protein isoform X2 [Rhodnius prolixus]|uniref:Protein BANP n=1 Tax=Rhodnius prolixus TaxID=13249 RepID=T1HLV8_RHOPR